MEIRLGKRIKGKHESAQYLESIIYQYLNNLENKRRVENQYLYSENVNTGCKWEKAGLAMDVPLQAAADMLHDCRVMYYLKFILRNLRYL